ncbi:Nucleoporin autopeptidase [Planoprotostelium fungivorum]|uniref:Nucleoporin autopeptidase n=1 Tax=Planoprotostelium fungivorum TaxID=1890364 RepID=A0A2P6NDP6_9EUKA|nr:Nucleoporin autopeptidase [Planoprotostelium fungivorum]
MIELKCGIVSQRKPKLMDEDSKYKSGAKKFHYNEGLGDIRSPVCTLRNGEYDSVFEPNLMQFGQPAAAPSFGGFGNTNTPSTPAFGASPFGAPASTPAFGAPASTPAFGAPASTPAFGAPSTGFGASTSTFPSFGAPAASTPAFGAASTPAFGGASTPAFGAASTPAFGAASTPAFGGASTPAFGGASTPAFGAASTPAFGGASTPPFGASTGGFSGFGASTPSFGSPFGATPAANNLPQAPSTPLGANAGYGQAQSFVITPQHRVNAIQEAYNTNSPNCRFRYMLYNEVNPSDVASFRKPDNVSQKAWNDAIENNPDPTRLVPVQANGFTELQERMEGQQKRAERHKTILNNISQQVTDMQRTHTLRTLGRIEEYKHAHMLMAQRILNLVKRMETIRWQGLPLPDGPEVAFFNRVWEAEQYLVQPDSIRGKLSELAALSYQEDDGIIAEEYRIEESELRKVHEFLLQQAEGISKMMKAVEQLNSDTQIKLEGIQQMKRDY